MATKPTYEELERKVREFHDAAIEYERMEKTLRGCAELYRNVYDTAPLAFVVWDLETCVTDWNMKAEEVFGWSKEEVLGREFFDFLIPQKDQSRVKSVVDSLVKAELPSYSVNDNLTKTGRVITCEWNNSLLHDDEGNVVGAISLALDITHRKEAEEALRKAHEESERTVKIRTKELREANKQLLIQQQKLQTLASKLSMAEERERRRIAIEVHDNIGQNLAYSKIKLNELRQFNSGVFSDAVGEIAQLIDETIQDTRSLISEIGSPVLYELGFLPAMEWLAKKVRQEQGLDVKIEDDGQPKPLSDDSKAFLFHAVRELLANIVKHAHAKCCTVSLAVKDGNIELDIVDDGDGFDPQKIQTEFAEEQAFGFFSIRERVGPLGGRLGVFSKPNEGTRITLVMPLA